MGALYTSNLVAMMTYPVINIPIKNMDDLIKSGIDYGFYNDGMAYDLIKVFIALRNSFFHLIIPKPFYSLQDAHG